MIRRKCIARMVFGLALIATTTGEDESFGKKSTPNSSVRGPRDVSSLNFGTPSTGYGAPPSNSYVPSSHHDSYGPPPPPASYAPPPPSSSYGSPSPSSSYGPPSPPRATYGPPTHTTYTPIPPPPSNSYGPPANNFGGKGTPGYGQNSHYEEDHSKWVPQPFEFHYSVVDAPTGNDYSHHQSGDGAGNVKGEYRVLLPDGRTQIVTYTATDQTGFQAQVVYQGEARQDQQQYYNGGGGNNQGSYSSGGYNNNNINNGGYQQQQQHSSNHHGPYRK